MPDSDAPVTVEVTADGAGLVSHAGTALLGQVAGELGLARAGRRLARIKQRRRGHDPGRVIVDLAVMLADGGECVSRSRRGPGAGRAVRAGRVGLDRVPDAEDGVASEPGMLDALRSAHASARERFWELHGAPRPADDQRGRNVITAHSGKEKAAGNYKHGYGFHPLGAYADETREALAMLLRAGNAGSNTAADHVTVIDRSLAQIPAEQLETIEILWEPIRPARRTGPPITVIGAACGSPSATN